MSDFFKIMIEEGEGVAAEAGELGALNGAVPKNGGKLLLSE